MKPSIGRIVHYKLNNADAQDVNRRRHDYMTFIREYTDSANPGATGHVAHFGNAVKPGDVFPAMIVKVHYDPAGSGFTNLQVYLDGNDTLWVTSRYEGDDEGEWAFPVITHSPREVIHVAPDEGKFTEKQLADLVNEIQKRLLQKVKRNT